jgi:hypothetical protein
MLEDGGKFKFNKMADAGAKFKFLQHDGDAVFLNLYKMVDKRADNAGSLNFI